MGTFLNVLACCTMQKEWWGRRWLGNESLNEKYFAHWRKRSSRIYRSAGSLPPQFSLSIQVNRKRECVGGGKKQEKRVIFFLGLDRWREVDVPKRSACNRLATK